MEWRSLALLATRETLEALEDTLWASGAVSVTVADADDNPIYEPGPGEEPLWDRLVVTGLFEEDVSLESLAELVVDEGWQQLDLSVLADKVWEREWLSRFRPMCFGERLWVCPSGYEVSEPGAVIMELDPGLAFGTGTHPTTRLCLEWLDGHIKHGMRVLDYGCGSGILGIGALLLGASSVVGVDNDPQALTATHDNAERNQVGDRFSRCLPAQFQVSEFDVVVANILAQPIIELADLLLSCVRPGGYLILSGIMSGQKDWVLAAYTRAEITEVREIDGWISIAARRPV